MRTIAIEEHFLASGYREAMKTNAPSQRGGSNEAYINVLTPMAKHLQHTVPEYFLQNFYITTSGFFTDPPLLLALQVMGADRIIFSVDYPFSANEHGRIFLASASISPADKEKIGHLNAERLLKLVAA